MVFSRSLSLTHTRTHPSSGGRGVTLVLDPNPSSELFLNLFPFICLRALICQPLWHLWCIFSSSPSVRRTLTSVLLPFPSFPEGVRPAVLYLQISCERRIKRFRLFFFLTSAVAPLLSDRHPTPERALLFLEFKNYPGPSSLIPLPTTTITAARCYERWCGWVMMSCVGGAITEGELHSPVVN